MNSSDPLQQDRNGASARPVMMAGVIQDGPNPTRRPMLRRVLTTGVVVTLFLVCALVLLAVLGESLQAQTAIIAALMAIIPLFIVVPTFLWLDRYEAEPIRYQLFGFFWGALVAVLGALFLNTLGLQLLVDAQWEDPLAAGATYLAPITEETLKGLGVLLIFLFRKREFDGIIDGIVYAGLVGAGFAFTENIVYLGQAYNEFGAEGLNATFFVRCLMGPFAHPLFTSLIGIGIGIAATTRRPGRRVLAIVLGWLGAMLLHASWNLSAVAGMGGFLVAYLMIQVPLFAAYVAFLFWLRRREGRMVGMHLSPYADAGWLTHGEVAMLANLPARKSARDWAKAHGGTPAKRSMQAFQDSATDLALLRSRLVRGTAEATAPERERVLLGAVTEHRMGFIGSPVV